VPSLPKPNTSANRTCGLFGNEDFLSDATTDGSRGPGDQAWTVRFATTAPGRPLRYSSTSAWQTCPRKPQCTRHKDNRSLTRWGHETLREEMQQRVAAHPEKVTARQGMVDHPLGPMQRGMDQGYFLTRGLGKVRGEMRLTILGSQLTSVRNILGVEALLTAGV